MGLFEFLESTFLSSLYTLDIIIYFCRRESLFVRYSSRVSESMSLMSGTMVSGRHGTGVVAMVAISLRESEFKVSKPVEG